MTYHIFDDLTMVYDSLLEPHPVFDKGYEAHFEVAAPLKWRIIDRLGHDHELPAYYEDTRMFLLWYYDNEKRIATVEFGYGQGEIDLHFVHGFETDEHLSMSLLYWLAGLR